MTTKISWVPNSQKVQKEDRPVNELDKQDGYVDQRSIIDLIFEFVQKDVVDRVKKDLAKDTKLKDFAEAMSVQTASPNVQKIKSILKSEENKSVQKGKPIRYNQMPVLKRIKIRELFTALAVQRKIDWNHLIHIIINWDSRRPATINVIWHPTHKCYYITDGQHTVLAIAVRAMLGLFPDIDPNDYLDIEVNCQVVETSDFSFAREHFLGINGEDKLPILPYDIHKIHVFSSRLDNSPQEKYILAERKQSELEKFNMIPVHPESVDRFKPGALIDVHLVSKLDKDDITFIGEMHDTYWPQEPVDPMELLPFQDLRKRLIKEGADFNSSEFKEFMRDLNAIVKEVAGGFAEFKNLTQQVYPEYHERAFGERPAGCPRDASLVLLIQLYEKAGGTYQYVPNSLLTRYKENGKNMFQCLSKEKRELFV